MLRLWFTAEDAARTVITPPDPFMETMYSIYALHGGRVDPAMRAWRAATHPRLQGDLHLVNGMRSAVGAKLDLSTLTGPTGSLEHSLDVLAGVAQDALDLEIDDFAATGGRIGTPLRPLLGSDVASRTALTGLLRRYHRQAIAPYWSRMRVRLEIERERCAQVLARDGLAGLFARLGPLGVRWEPPVLEITRGPRRKPGNDLHLGGRGLRVAPAVFGGAGVMVFRSLTADRTSTLVYPVRLDLTSPEPPRAAALAAMLGDTRARVLAAVGAGTSTTRLAARVGISVSSASEHATVLRAAGLISTERGHGGVCHVLTPLGRAVLDPVSEPG